MLHLLLLGFCCRIIPLFPLFILSSLISFLFDLFLASCQFSAVNFHLTVRLDSFGILPLQSASAPDYLAISVISIVEASLSLPDCQR